MNFVFNDGGRAAAGFKGEASDCVTRAIAIATGMPYQEVYNLMNKRVKQTGRSLSTRGARNGVPKDLTRIMAELGWRWVPTMMVGRGTTVHLRKEELPSGTIIVKLSKHVAAVIDGVVHDTHDCSRDGSRCVYGYYVKKN